MQKHREHLADQQEIVAALADIVIDIYAVESALARAQKAAGTSALRGATSPASAAASGSAPSLTGGAGIASAATLGTGGVGTSGIGASGTGTSGVGGVGGGTGVVGIGGGGAAAGMAAAARVLLHDGAARVEG